MNPDKAYNIIDDAIFMFMMLTCIVSYYGTTISDRVELLYYFRATLTGTLTNLISGIYYIYKNYDREYTIHLR